MTVHNCTSDCERHATCSACGLWKRPRGRSVPVAAENGMCGWDCPGYTQDPQVGHLWPGEVLDLAAESWPHLLARVLYVPGVLAAVSRREWEAGCEDTTEAVPETECHWTLPSRDTWPSWAIAPWARSLAPWGGGDT